MRREVGVIGLARAQDVLGWLGREPLIVRNGFPHGAGPLHNTTRPLSNHFYSTKFHNIPLILRQKFNALEKPHCYKVSYQQEIISFDVAIRFGRKLIIESFLCLAHHVFKGTPQDSQTTGGTASSRDASSR